MAGEEGGATAPPSSPVRHDGPMGEEGLSAGELGRIADEITTRLGYVDIVVTGAGMGSALPHRCADVLTAQLDGEDPTADWRRQVGANQAAYYGAAAPPQVGAAFVLQWYLGVLALPLAGAAVLSPWVLAGTPETLSYDLVEPELFPIAIGVTAAGATAVSDPAARLDLAHERYLAHATAFAEAYHPPEVRMGSGQRGGLVHDAWTMAFESAREWVGSPGDHPPRSRRRGCCMIYALPGAQECAACPRGGRR